MSAASGTMSGRRVLYTGAAGGLGHHTTLELLGAGAEVLALDYDAEKIAALETAAGGMAGRLQIVRCDLSDRSALEAELGRLAAAGTIDVVLNNAAIYPSKPFEDYSMDEHDRIHAINVSAALSSVRAALPGMRDRGWGRIVNVTSITLTGHWDNLVPYIQSKGALLGLTRAWAREFGQWGITVNAIAPGAFPTDAEKIHPDPEAYERRILDAQAIKRRGAPKDIAAAMLFLCSDRAGFITGQSLAVNGGWTMD